MVQSTAQTVMVVDDEKDIADVIANSLRTLGMAVHAFDDSGQALDHLSGCKDCFLVISDRRMPGISGFELVRQVKKVRPEMKILIITSFEINKPEFDKVMPSTKVDGFIRKPFTRSSLIEVIDMLRMN